jgi:hypothetical protein
MVESFIGPADRTQLGVFVYNSDRSCIRMCLKMSRCRCVLWHATDPYQLRPGMKERQGCCICSFSVRRRPACLRGPRRRSVAQRARRWLPGSRPDARRARVSRKLCPCDLHCSLVAMRYARAARCIFCHASLKSWHRRCTANAMSRLFFGQST